MVGTAIYYSSSSYVIYPNIIVQAPVQQLITFAPQSLLNYASLKSRCSFSFAPIMTYSKLLARLCSIKSSQYQILIKIRPESAHFFVRHMSSTIKYILLLNKRTSNLVKEDQYEFVCVCFPCIHIYLPLLLDMQATHSSIKG